MTRYSYVNSSDRKRTLVRQAKSQPCVDCLAEGRRADWPWESMSLDHCGPKKMDFTYGGMVSLKRAAIERRSPSFLLFTVSEIRAELATCEPVCQSHHAARTRAQNRGRRQRQELAGGQGLLTETVPTPPRRSAWYEILVRHSPAIWDA